MKFRFIFLAAITLCLSLRASAQGGSIQGQLWVVYVGQALDATFPAPSATPDATFSTNGIAYIGQQPNNCYTIETFLAECATAAYNLTFSGLNNPYLGGVAGPDTPMSGPGWGVMIEFTGTVNLKKNHRIFLVQDDGVSLKIDGTLVPGFPTGQHAASLTSEPWVGAAGSHSFDLLYANATGGGAWLLFMPELY
jgi:hypothetical protein